MNIEYHKDLRTLHTMACEAFAECYVAVHTEQELRQALSYAHAQGQEVCILGGGSNVIFMSLRQGLLIHLLNKGRSCKPIEKRHRVSFSEPHLKPHHNSCEQAKTDASSPGHSQECFRVTAAAGENWHEFVLWTLQQGLRGLENLSLIPGTVGAAPIQNIGAYGVELARHIESVQAIHKITLEVKQFSPEQCRFGYRDSVFKRSAVNWIIWQVTFILSPSTPLVTDYAELQNGWQQLGCPDDALAISQLVCGLRQRKLPDPAALPNSGSFFKNPLVHPAHYRRLQQQFPGLVCYPQADGRYKLAAGWLIEQAGWKGYQQAGVGVCATQALVLVNPAGRPAIEVLALADEIQHSVESLFGVRLEREPVLL